MGEFIVTGDDQRHDFLQYVIANDLDRLHKANMALYTQLVMPHGGTVDDLIVYRRAADYLLVVNASNIDKDWKWLNDHAGKFPNVHLKNVSDSNGTAGAARSVCDRTSVRMAAAFVKDMPSFTYAEAPYLVCRSVLAGPVIPAKTAAKFSVLPTGPLTCGKR